MSIMHDVATTAYPCPQWCAGHVEPLEREQPEDRNHWSVSEDIELSLRPHEVVGGKKYPATLQVGLAQHVRHAEPAFDFDVNDRDAFDLTVDEAEQLRDRLTEYLARLGR